MSDTVGQFKMPNSEVYIEVRRDKGLSLTMKTGNVVITSGTGWVQKCNIRFNRETVETIWPIKLILVSYIVESTETQVKRGNDQNL